MLQINKLKISSKYFLDVISFFESINLSLDEKIETKMKIIVA